MLRKLLFVVALALASTPLTAQIRTIGGGSTCCSAATITPIDSIRFTGTASAIRGGAGNMTIQAGTGASRTLTLQTMTAGSTAINTLTLGADSSATAIGPVVGMAPGIATVARVPFAFSGDPNSGLYSGGADNTQLVAGGRLVFGGGTTFSALYVNDAATVKAFANRVEIDPGALGTIFRVTSDGVDTTTISTKVLAASLTAAAGTPNSVCMNATTKEIVENAATSCVVSSRRFKQNILPLSDVVAARITSQLKPSVFKYKDGGRNAIGLIAEEVDSVDSRLAFRNDKGQVNSVNYEQVTVVLLKQVQGLTAKLDRMCKAGIREAC